MRWLIFLLLAVGAHTNQARGQLAVQLKSEKDTFLVYESIPLTVLIRNLSGRTIELTAQVNRPWLSFLVSDDSGRIIPALGTPKADGSALIAPGQTISRTIDLLPLFDIRARGSYRIQVRVDSAGTSAISAPVSLTVINGREIWSQTAGLPAKEGAADEYRTYTLIARRAEQEDLLHVSVSDDHHQVVYGVLALGGFITLKPPDPRIDKEGHLHVLYQVGPRSFGYVVIDPYAKIVNRAIYSDIQSSPRLVVTDGEVVEQGGEMTYPKPEHVMSENELKPPPPPPPKPKRHWWWPFGGHSTPKQSAP
ncbi:MAG TPA: hypothetical protein VLZ12_15885 [Verrucomicrobiae bacterium]|nr:hypothetical protein [Verrucomicrobiae bacterium]